METTTPLARQYAEEALAWPWRGDPAKTGRTLLFDLNKERGWFMPTPRYINLPGVPSHCGHGTGVCWRRLPTDAERAQPGAYAYDRTAHYLSLADGVMLPHGAPEWTPGAAYAKAEGKGARAGLWHVRVRYNGSPWNGRGLPAVCREGDAWLWTPSLRAALDCGYDVQPGRGAVLWPEQHRTLRTWKERIWQARQMLQEAPARRFPDLAARAEAVRLVKLTYAKSIGYFAHPPDVPGAEPRWYRPEWQRIILSESVARMFVYARKAHAAGYPPLWMRTDTIAFVKIGDGGTRETGETAGLNMTPGQCGAFRYVYAVPMQPYLVNPGHQYYKARPSDVSARDLPTVRP